MKLTGKILLAKLNLLEVPTKPRPQNTLQIQPNRKIGVRIIWSRPIKKQSTDDVIFILQLYWSRFVKQ